MLFCCVRNCLCACCVLHQRVVLDFCISVACNLHHGHRYHVRRHDIINDNDYLHLYRLLHEPKGQGTLSYVCVFIVSQRTVPPAAIGKRNLPIMYFQPDVVLVCLWTGNHPRQLQIHCRCLTLFCTNASLAGHFSCASRLQFVCYHLRTIAAKTAVIYSSCSLRSTPQARRCLGISAALS